MSLESILHIIYDMKSKVIDVESDMVDSSLPNVAVSDKELEEIEQECGIIFPEAVSYTHLDVYKRQHHG